MSIQASPPIVEPNPDMNVSRYRIGPAIAVALFAVVLGSRFFWIIRKYSVNIFFLDQWDYLTPFFQQKATFANLFFLEHGPHREGVGLLADKFLYPLTHWNARVDSFVIGALAFASMLVALRLRYLLYGALSYSDIAIPAIFLTMQQYEMVLFAPNPSHSHFPLFMILLYCMALLSSNRLMRYAGILFLNVLLIYTGFGIFMGVITLCIFFLECYWSCRHMIEVPFAYPFTALLIATASLASFFLRYVWQSAVGCFELPHDHWLQYPQFMALMFSAFVVPGRMTVTSGKRIIGWAILLLVIIALRHHILRLLKSPKSQNHLIGAVLLSFSLLFAANTAIGRCCLGPAVALSSRYMPLLIPAFLAIYFYLLSKSWADKRKLIVPALVILILPATLSIPRNSIRPYIDGKRRWANCYVRTGDLHYCDKSSNFVIFPDPERTNLQQKLDYLRQNHLNLFAEPLTQ